MNYKVIYGKNDLVYTGFLALPGKLYQKNELTQDYDTEYKLLHEKHTLSKYFNITPFVVIDKNSQMPVARCMLTYYPEDDVAYFGFFECIGQQEIAEQLLDTVSKKAKKDGKTKLSGPVDASFWIKYRLKINLFDRIPYTGEPYNKNYLTGFPYHSIYGLLTAFYPAAGKLIVVIFQAVYHGNLVVYNDNTSGRIANKCVCTFLVIFLIHLK